MAKRNVNFDILRSLSMLFVVMIHYLGSVGPILRFDISTFSGGGKLCVVTFMFYTIYYCRAMLCYDIWLLSYW